MELVVEKVKPSEAMAWPIRARRAIMERDVEIAALRKELEIERTVSRNLAASIGVVTEYVSTEGSNIADAVGGHIGDDVGPVAVRMLQHLRAEVERMERVVEEARGAVEAWNRADGYYDPEFKAIEVALAALDAREEEDA